MRNRRPHGRRLIEEIREKFRETDYPGSSLTCGVYPLFYNQCKSTAMYYPAKNCVLLDDDTLIKVIVFVKLIV